MSIRQSFSSRFRQFTSLRQTTIEGEGKKMGLVNFPFDRCDLALTRLDEVEHERLSNGKSSLGESSCSIRISQKNRNANRYSDIVSFDHSLLSGDYLNASFIPPIPNQDQNPKGRAYIASQAPLPHTLSTFYEKIIQSNTKLIVNLTPFEERGKLKADKYWPLKASQQFNISQTHADLTSISSEGSGLRYIIRQSKEPVLLDKKLQATIFPLKIFEQTGEKKEIDFSVLHITSWVDFGNYPERIFEQVLEMIDEQYRQATSEEQTKDSPIWVHCSAGVGRSGTVIASMLARESSLHDILKVSPSTISTPGQLLEASMEGATKLIDYERTFRPRMVQNGQQFEMVAAVVAKQIQRGVDLN